MHEESPLTLESLALRFNDRGFLGHSRAATPREAVFTQKLFRSSAKNKIKKKDRESATAEKWFETAFSRRPNRRFPGIKESEGISSTSVARRDRVCGSP